MGLACIAEGQAEIGGHWVDGPKWIVPPDTIRQTPKASPVHNNKRKQQIVLSEHAARNLTSTNVTFANL